MHTTTIARTTIFDVSSTLIDHMLDYLGEGKGYDWLKDVEIDLTLFSSARAGRDDTIERLDATIASMQFELDRSEGGLVSIAEALRVVRAVRELIVISG